MTDETTAGTRHARHSLPLAVLAAAWVLYLGFIGPWLISEASTVAVLIGIGAGLGLATATYYRLKQPVSTKENTR